MEYAIMFVVFFIFNCLFMWRNMRWSDRLFKCERVKLDRMWAETCRELLGTGKSSEDMH